MEMMDIPVCVSNRKPLITLQGLSFFNLIQDSFDNEFESECKFMLAIFQFIF